jgi:hypothetical protein
MSLIKDIYLYFINRNKSINDFIEKIFPKESWETAKVFFGQYMTNKHKYMEIDCYSNSIITAEEFFERASFYFELFYHNHELCRDNICRDNCSYNNYIYLHEDQGVYFNGKDKCLLLSENFSCFVYEICQHDYCFRKLIESWFPNLQLPMLKKYDLIETKKFLLEFYKKYEEYGDCVSFDFMNPDGLLIPFITKESFFYRAMFNLSFPPEQLSVKDDPKKELYWGIGYGWGEDIGGTEGNIAIHSRTGEILYYEYPFPSPTLTTRDFIKIANSLAELIELLKKHKAIINGVLIR